jgi:hypothetical protein
MGLKDNWVDKINGVDINSADDINQVAHAVIELEKNGTVGGKNGATFTPSVSADGVISWTNDQELPNPVPVNIKGNTGADGKDGQNGEDGADGISPTISVTSITGGHRIAITDKNGTKNIDVMDGVDGSAGKDGTNGKDGTSVTVTNVSTSNADGGSNVVTFSDGKTLTVKNGSKGSAGTAGKTPVRGTDYWTDADKAEIVNAVSAVSVAKNQGTANVGKILVVGADGNLTLAEMPEGASGDVIGMIDANNNIIITGDLADGTYVFKYENANGTYADIGSLVVGGVVQYSITALLTECTAVSGNETVIEEGGTVTLKYVAKDGFALTDTVTVSGAEYTWDSTTGTLVLSNPTSDVTVTIIATKSGYTNLLDTIGYDDGHRISASSGGLSQSDGRVAIGYIEIAPNDIIRIKGMTFPTTQDGTHIIATYKIDDKTFVSGSRVYHGMSVWNGLAFAFDGDLTTITYNGSMGICYIRVSGSATTGANCIVTINEEITD